MNMSMAQLLRDGAIPFYQNIIRKDDEKSRVFSCSIDQSKYLRDNLNLQRDFLKSFRFHGKTGIPSTKYTFYTSKIMGLVDSMVARKFH